MEVKAFSPADARKHKVQVIPAEILEATNELISTRYTPGNPISITLAEIVKLAKEKMVKNNNPQAEENFFTNHWLDIESVYEDAGWKVYFDKPGYNESYSAYFKFSEKRGRGSNRDD